MVWVDTSLRKFVKRETKRERLPSYLATKGICCTKALCLDKNPFRSFSIANLTSSILSNLPFQHPSTTSPKILNCFVSGNLLVAIISLISS